MPLSLQEQYAPKSVCYGCGPANPQGLQIKSFVENDRVVATFHPKPFHHAFPNVLCGGIIGTLLDCHCNWTACYYLMQAKQLAAPPCTVTADYAIQLKRPTPMGVPLQLSARVIDIQGNKATVYGELIANDKECDTCTGTFVMVSEGHPAFHRW